MIALVLQIDKYNINTVVYLRFLVVTRITPDVARRLAEAAVRRPIARERVGVSRTTAKEMVPEPVHLLLRLAWYRAPSP